MISYFNSAYPARYVTALLMALVLWIPSLIFVTYVPVQDSLFSQFVIDRFIHTYSHYLIWGSLVFTYISAVAINQILKEYELVNMNNTMGLALFIAFASALSLFTSVNVFTLANLFLILMIQGILRLSRAENPVTIIFNTSFFTGIASLFFTPLLFLVVIIWIALVMNRHVDIRNFIISLMGILLPYLFLFTWFYWNDSLTEHWHETIEQVTDIGLLHAIGNPGVFEVLAGALSLLILVLAVLRAIGRFAEGSISMRRNVLLILYYLTASFLITLLYSETALSLMILIPPSVMLVAATVSIKKNSGWNMLFTLYIFIIMLNQYSGYLFDVTALLFR